MGKIRNQLSVFPLILPFFFHHFIKVMLHIVNAFRNRRQLVIPLFINLCMQIPLGDFINHTG